MASIFHILKDGGVIFSYLIIALLFVELFLFFKGLSNNSQNSKSIALLTSIGWFALAWGFLGRTIGLIHAFDNVQAAGELTPSLLAGGIKMALVDPLLGIFTFCFARLAIIILVLRNKEIKD